MTGVGGRPEVIVEGANDPEGPWKAYEFQYKPGDLDTRPGFNIPHQPRLDWQLWFAALGRYQQNPWFVSMLHRLMENEPTVTHLIAKNPFEKQGPKFIRAQLYLYHYTSWNPADRRYSNTSYWWRELQHEYLNPVPKHSLDNFLTSANLHPAEVTLTWIMDVICQFLRYCLNQHGFQCFFSIFVKLISNVLSTYRCPKILCKKTVYLTT